MSTDVSSLSLQSLLTYERILISIEALNGEIIRTLEFASAEPEEEKVQRTAEIDPVLALSQQLSRLGISKSAEPALKQSTHDLDLAAQRLLELMDSFESTAKSIKRAAALIQLEELEGVEIYKRLLP